MRLNEVEARLLGVLIEKEKTTPDGYPLTLNALRAAANQKSNRDPVVSWSEAEILVGVQGLVAKDLAEHLPPGTGARVERWSHRSADKLSLDSAQLAVLAELLLRGAQAPGELRQRANRMHALTSLADLTFVTDKLLARGLIRRLAPGAGSRAERWQHCLGEYAAEGDHAPPPRTAEEVVARHDGEPSIASNAPAAPPVAPRSATESTLEERVSALERRIEKLERELGV